MGMGIGKVSIVTKGFSLGLFWPFSWSDLVNIIGPGLNYFLINNQFGNKTLAISATFPAELHHFRSNEPGNTLFKVLFYDIIISLGLTLVLFV